MGFGETFTPGMTAGCVLVLTLVVCKILGERQEIKETFESGRHRYFYPCWFFCVFLVFFFSPKPDWQPGTETKVINRDFLFGLSFWMSFVSVLMTSLLRKGI